jgi:hypothetical protein
MLIVGILSRSNPLSENYSNAISEGIRDALREMGYPLHNQ